MRPCAPGTAVVGDPIAVLALTDESSLTQNGAFLTTDLAPGRVVRGFAATFELQLRESSRFSEGISFNWAADLPNGAYAIGEAGAGSGLSVAFDTGVSDCSFAPAIEVWWGKSLVARRYMWLILFDFSFPYEVQIRLSPDGLLDMSCNCDTVFAGLPVPGYSPQLSARFGLGQPPPPVRG